MCIIVGCIYQLENCGRPAIVTKDLSMVIYGRDARTGPRSLKNLFSGAYRNPEANRLSGVYELSLRRASEAGSPGSHISTERERSGVLCVCRARVCLYMLVCVWTYFPRVRWIPSHQLHLSSASEQQKQKLQ